jgi:cytochrome c biogenesis factor
VIDTAGASNEHHWSEDAIATMTDPAALRTRRDIAYACFLLIGATALLGSLGSLLPEALINPAYLGFFVLIPLTFASAIALVTGAVLALVVGRKDPILITLLTFTAIVIAFAIAVFSESMSVRIEGPATDVLIVVYGVANLWVCIRWFAVVRRKK